MPTDPIQCWSCGEPRAAFDALCPHCGKVQPPPPLRPRPAASPADGAGGSGAAPAGAGAAPGGPDAIDKFATLGLSRLYDLDPAALEERFKALSRKLHPDRFVRGTKQERRFSLEQTTRLNDAYRTLKDPVRRAEHLLELRGVQMGEGMKVELPPEFLERTLEDREKLLEARVEGGPAAVEALAQGVRRERDETMARVGAALRGLEATPDANPDLRAVTELLARLRYHARYLDEVEGRAPEL